MDAIEFLNRDFLTFAPVIDMINAQEANITGSYPFGIELYHKNDMLIICLDNDQDIKHFLPKINTGILTVFYGAKDKENIKNIVTNLTSLVHCHQMVYTKKEPPSIKYTAEFRFLDESYAEFLYNNYTRRSSDSSYMHQLCKDGKMFGMFVDGQIVGFAGRHSDGSMGFLEVLPQFKQRGYGKQIANKTIEIILKEGRLPFAHIVEGNQISLSLNSSIDGAKFSDRFVSWISTKK